MNRVDFKRSLAAWVEEERQASGEHPTVEALDAYHAGRLGPQEREGLRDHLVLCRQCLDLLQDLEAFAQARRSASGPPPPVADFETAAFRHGLRPLLEAPSEPPAADRPPRRTAAGGAWRLPAAAVAASVLVTALGFSFWIADQQRALAASERQLVELRMPRPNTRIYDLYLDTSERSGESHEQAVEVPAGSMLILTPRDPGGHPSYAVEILDSGGARAWIGRGFSADPEDGTFTLWLPPDFLPPGEYRVRLLGGDADPSELVEEYVVRMVR